MIQISLCKIMAKDQNFASRTHKTKPQLKGSQYGRIMANKTMVVFYDLAYLLLCQWEIQSQLNSSFLVKSLYMKGDGELRKPSSGLNFNLGLSLTRLDYRYSLLYVLHVKLPS